jgi:acetyl-CoA acyltransferase
VRGRDDGGRRRRRAQIAFGAIDIAIAGGVEHMGRHPMGEGVDPNPRIVAEKLVDPVGAGDGQDRGEPARPLPAADQGAVRTPIAVASQDKLAAAYAEPARSSRTW